MSIPRQSCLVADVFIKFKMAFSVEPKRAILFPAIWDSCHKELWVHNSMSSPLLKMSCPENELIKYPFYKVLIIDKLILSEVILWLLVSLTHGPSLFCFARISHALGNRIPTGKCLWNKEKNIYYIYQWHQACNICLIATQKLIQTTFTHFALWWFSDTFITLVTKWLWHYSGSTLLHLPVGTSGCTKRTCWHRDGCARMRSAYPKCHDTVLSAHSGWDGGYSQ